MSETTGSAERNYIAFISYRHKPLDKEAAEKIQRSIERYIVPKELREKAGGKKLGMVFRDEDELPASSSLSGSITYALDHSKYLLVICTPDLPLSRWCEQEIRYFLKTHDRDHVLAVLVDGEPEVSFSPYLLHTFDEEGNITGDTEPLAANIAGENHSIDKKAFKKEIVRIYAALLGCPFDALWQRERRARANRLLALGAAAMTVMAVFLVTVLMKNAEISQRNREIEAQNAEIQAKNEAIQAQNEEISQQNEEIREQNDTIAAQNDSLQRNLSTALVDGGLQKLEAHDVKGALENGLAALLDDGGALTDPRADALLSEGLASYQASVMRCRLIYEQITDITDMIPSPDRTRVYLADGLGVVRCVTLSTGELLWEAPPPIRKEASQTHLTNMEAAGLLLSGDSFGVTALNPDTGEIVWQWISRYYDGCGFHALTPDGNSILVLDKRDTRSSAIDLIVLNASTGEEQAALPLAEEGIRMDLSETLLPWPYWGGTFSEDGGTFALAGYGKDEREDAKQDYALCVFLVDTESWSLKDCWLVSEARSSGSRIFGLSFTEGGDLFVARFAYSYGGIIVTRFDHTDGSHYQTRTHQAFSSSDGITFTTVKSPRNLPLLSSENVLLVGYSSTLHVFSADTLEELKSFGFQGELIHMAWLNRESEAVEIMTADGVVAFFDLNGSSDSILQQMSSDSFGAAGVTLAIPVGQSPLLEKDGLLLAVSQDHPNQLLLGEKLSDPGAVPVGPESTNFGTGSFVAASPSEKTLLIYYYDDGYHLDRFDTEQQKYLGPAGLELSYSDTPFPLDDERILLGVGIYEADGSVTPFEGVSEDDLSHSSRFHSLRLSDGRVMTLEDNCFDGTIYGPCRIWLDGVPVKNSNDLLRGFSIASEEDPILSPAGMVLGYGFWAKGQNRGYGTLSEEEAFVAFDANRGERILIKNARPGDSPEKLAVLNRDLGFVCLYDTGEILLYRLNDEEPRSLALPYRAGEVRDLSVTLDDGQLLIFTRSGLLEVWDLDSGEKLFSGASGVTGNNLSYYTRLRSDLDPETGMLYVYFTYEYNQNYGYWLALNRQNWSVTGQAEDVYGVYSGRLYCSRNWSLVSYPVYSREDLSAMAREKLSEWRGEE